MGKESRLVEGLLVEMSKLCLYVLGGSGYYYLFYDGSYAMMIECMCHSGTRGSDPFARDTI